MQGPAVRSVLAGGTVWFVVSLACLPFFALALVLVDPARSAKRDPHFWRTVSMFLGPYTGLPMALLAVLVALITSAPARRAET